MRVLVTHYSLNTCGGAERAALHVIKALMEAGYDVELGTIEKTDWSKVLGTLGVGLPKIPKEHLLVGWVIGQLRAFGIYTRQLAALCIARLRRRFDIVLNTHGDVLPLPADITYVQGPPGFALVRKEPWRCKYRKFLWRLYFEPYRIFGGLIADHALSKSLVITVSKFMQREPSKHLGVRSLVIHPPTEVQDYV